MSKVKINETIRADGLRIISCYVPNKKSVEVKLIARVGCAYDPTGKEGLSHCLEHMAFKGTKKRTLKELQSIEHKNLFDANASTGVLKTTYEASVIDRRLPLAFDYLCDVYFNAIFPSAELEREKRAITLEIRRGYDDDEELADQTMDERLYKTNPIRLDAAGTIESVKRITRSDLIKQKEKYHIPSNTIAIAVGNVRHGDFVREINKRVRRDFAKVALKEWSDESDQLPPKKEVVVLRPGRQKTILLAGCKLPKNMSDRAVEAFGMFSKLIGNTADSRLWNEIRQKRGLAYVIKSDCYYIAGLANFFRVYAEINPEKKEAVEKILWKSLLRPLSEKRGFESLKSRIFDAFEVSATEHLSDYGALVWRKIIEGKPVKDVESDDQKRLKIISETSLKDLEKVRKEFIRPERFVTVVVEPTGKK